MTGKGHINTFSGGMNKDTSYSKYPNNQYEDARNLRVVTDTGLTTGALINIEGNEKFISIPNIIRFSKINNNFSTISDFGLFLEGGVFVSSSGTYINNNAASLVDSINNDPNFQNYGIKAILLGEKDDDNDYSDLVVLSYSYNITGTINSGNSGSVWNYNFRVISNPKTIGTTLLRDNIILFTTDNVSQLGGEGQIWEVIHDKTNDSSSIELIYSNNLNFSTEYPIEAVSRYETSSIQRIYWTDNFNPLRRINIRDNNRFLINKDSLSLKPYVNLRQGQFTKIGEINSGLLDRGTYQFSYRLKSRTGNYTVLAPFSSPISINSAPENVEDFNYQRSNHLDPSLPSNKTLSIFIEELNSGFEYIEIFLLKRGNQEGELFKVNLIKINSLNNFEYTITGEEGDFESVFRDDIENFSVEFSRVKTLTIKDNRLIVANITEDSTEIIYDARAYRYLQGTDNTYSNEDDINPFNRDSTRSQGEYKFSKNSSTLGGSGINVSYSFTTKNILLDLFGTEINSFPLSSTSKTLQSLILNNKVYNAGGLWNNYRNPYLENLITSYQRDETYRFGILFYDKYSKPTDVKWIGDIRMPAQNEVSITAFTSEGLVGRPLGLNFNVDISSIKDKISGFSIVRAPRPNKDKTILGQGVISEIVKMNVNPYNIHSDPDKEFPESKMDIGSLPQYISAATPKLFSIDRQSTLPDIPMELQERIVSFDSPQLLSGVGDPLGYGNFIGDETLGIYPSLSSNLYLKPVKITNGNTNSAPDGFPLAQEDDPYKTLILNSANQYVHPTNPNYVLVGSSFGKYSGSNNVSVSDSLNLNYKIKINGAIRTNFYKDNFLLGNYTNTNLLGVGSTGLLYKSIVAGTRTNSNSNSILIGLNSSYLSSYDKFTGTLINSKPNITEKLEALYDLDSKYRLVSNIYRDYDGQYGGNTNLNRQNTTYISTGHYQFIDNNSPDIINAEVFGGDTFINLVPITKSYPSVRLNKDNGGDDFVRISNRRRFFGMLIPLESTINIDMVYEKSFADVITSDERSNRANEDKYSVTEFKSFPLKNFNPFPVVNESLESHIHKAKVDLDVIKFQSENYSNTYNQLPLDFVISNSFDNRIYSSAAKINGESYDSWSSFSVNDTMDVDGHYGSISKIETFNDSLVFFQERALGVVSINPRALIQDLDGNQLELGVGQVLSDYKYISNDIGCRHQRGVVRSKKRSLFF
jgi:hypothetical protein